MSKITSRLPLIDWDNGFENHWNGNASATHVFNALSFMFPQGERFFIKVVKEVSCNNAKLLPEALSKDIEAFVRQEVAHTKHHQIYNTHLEKQGYKNVMFDYLDRLEKITFKHFSPMSRLAIVCAYEHYTAILGNYLLNTPEALASASKKMSLIWEWHAAEETEHKAVCFDLYTCMDGSWLNRVGMFLLVSFNFSIIFSRLYFSMLWRDGAFNIRVLHKTIWQSAKFFWGVKGVGWHVVFFGVKYVFPGFHPWNQNNQRVLKEWFIKNNRSLTE